MQIISIVSLYYFNGMRTKGNETLKVKRMKKDENERNEVASAKRKRIKTESDEVLEARKIKRNEI